MTKQYENHYRILGIQPGASWKQLRQAYKSLVNKWHPDRYQQDLRQRKLAEEKTKEITKAYKDLAEYYKKFDSLPLPAEVPADIDPVTSGTQPPPDMQPSSADPATHAAPTHAAPEPEQKNKFWTARAKFLAAAGLIGAIYLMTLPDPPESDEQVFVSEENDDMTNGAVRKAAPAIQPEDGKYFTIGSTIGEVYAIQGVPTRTEENIWYYGKSKVLFSNGKVSGWEEGPEDLLRINIAINNSASPSHFFRIGSSKQEVLAVQGPPDRDAGSVWDYGASRIYFESEQVSGWHEAPFDRLKTRR